MNENELAQDDEISLFDMLQKLLAGWRYLAGGAIVGLLGAVLMVMISPVRYEAVSAVQAARVAGKEIEPVSTILERLHSPVLLIDALRAANEKELAESLLQGVNPAGKQFPQANLMKNTSLIQISTRGRSPDQARVLNEAVVKALAARHRELAQPMVNQINNDIGISREKLAASEKELSEINRLSNQAVPADARFTQQTLVTNLRLSKQAELFSLRQSIFAQEQSLLSPATQDTAPVESAFVSQRPVSPRKGLMLALGLIGGVLAGIVLLFLADAWRHYKREPA